MKLGWLPLQGRITGFPPPAVTGFMTIDALLAGRWDRLASALAHLTLPAVTLAVPALATVVRFTRAGVLDTLSKPFVTYQDAIGIPRALIVWKYVLRNALTSTVTQIGLLFGILLAGAVVIETVFQWPGIGTYAFEVDPAVRLRGRHGLHGLCRRDLHAGRTCSSTSCTASSIRAGGGT